MADIFQKALNEVAWSHPTPQIIGGIYLKAFPDLSKIRLSETYTQLRERLKREGTPPPSEPPPPEPQLLSAVIPI